jgi:hypothetical protein
MQPRIESRTAYDLGVKDTTTVHGIAGGSQN